MPLLMKSLTNTRECGLFKEVLAKIEEIDNE